MAEFTVAERDSLKAAIASGIQTVTFNNRTVTYQSLSDMLEVLALMERSLSGGTRAYRLAVTHKMGSPAE